MRRNLGWLGTLLGADGSPGPHTRDGQSHRAGEPVGISSAIASGIAWPDLPNHGYVSGRTSTVADVKAGNAAFAALGKNGEGLSTPLQMKIPQYALHLDKGVEVPIIVIQAENTPDGETIGYKFVDRP
jgi:hypothetical protein